MQCAQHCLTLSGKNNENVTKEDVCTWAAKIIMAGIDGGVELAHAGLGRRRENP